MAELKSWMYHPDSYQQNKQDAYLELKIPLSDCGQMPESFPLLETEEQEVIDTIMLENTSKKEEVQKSKKKLNHQNEEKYAIVESLLEDKKTTLNDKSISSKKNTQTTNSSKTLEAESTSKERVLKKLSEQQLKEKLNKLWLPIKTDCVDLGLTLSNGLLKSFPEGKSWFSTTVKVPQNKKSSTTCCQSLTCSQQRSMVLENTKQKSKKSSKPPKSSSKNKNLKAKKVALYPTTTQKKTLDVWFGAYRWFYNRTIDYCEENKVYNFKKDGIEKGIKDKYGIPEWCNKIPARIIRGGIVDCCAAYKTSFALLKNKVITHFKMKYKTKKDRTQCLLLTKDVFGKDNAICPSVMKPIKGIYNRKDKSGFVFYPEKNTWKFFKTKLKDMEINHDVRMNKIGNKYYLYIPYEKIEKQTEGNGLISIDSGCRTFQTGYGLDHTVEIGVNCADKLMGNLNTIDMLTSVASKCKKQTRKKIFSRIKRINLKIKNKINDLHWKVIDYLTKNYKIIIISDFDIRSLLQNKNLHSSVKRRLSILSHGLFKIRLREKCKDRGNILEFVEESYTSKTCTNCGVIKDNLGSNKTFECDVCKIIIDRDVNGARNMLVKSSISPAELHVGA